MEIRKESIFSSPSIAPSRHREAAAAARRADSQGLENSGALAKREAKVYVYNSDEFESLAQRVEGRRAAADFGAQHLSSTITDRARQALRAYQLQLDMPQDEARTALRQMLGIDAYA